MDTRTIRSTSVTLPGLDVPGLYLSHVTSLEGGRGRLGEFHYAGADLRALDLVDVHLTDGRITGLRAQRARLDQLRLASVEFTGCDLAALRWTDSKLSRVVFRDCKLLGAALEDVTLDNVLFDRCKLDYATLTRVRTTGPVILTGCTLRESLFATCDLGAATLDDCDLRDTGFDGGNCRDLDLRGNDLSQIRGLSALRQIVIDQPQTIQLAQALATELKVSFGEDPC